ncbi:hypothetical protein BO82DRAFT_437020 [Aspergillus uvarum CBS 121591]|uniref:Uncharacterized protein n=1 Tax=Aspergillus uvarum CBS 121591 TaxID=1448315 RepID=A0A319BTN6_9EURO|nr:hypothetical protein BO82DRAFT_437020 [Aspergillus uvarum CBS 121591]PYH75944.1 hypothetical protein BO82DRAFT_437020 [Aspergillus uvarum CBS 121591]
MACQLDLWGPQPSSIAFTVPECLYLPTILIIEMTPLSPHTPEQNKAKIVTMPANSYLLSRRIDLILLLIVRVVGLANAATGPPPPHELLRNAPPPPNPSTIQTILTPPPSVDKQQLHHHHHHHHHPAPGLDLDLGLCPSPTIDSSSILLAERKRPSDRDRNRCSPVRAQPPRLTIPIARSPAAPPKPFAVSVKRSPYRTVHDQRNQGHHPPTWHPSSVACYSGNLTTSTYGLRVPRPGSSRLKTVA